MGIGGLIVLVADIWVTLNVVRSDAATGGALLWILLILLLLVYAFLIGLFAGPRAAES
jgi:hypothetical protein